MGRKNRDTEIRRGLFGLGAKFTPEARAAEKISEDLSFDLLNLPIRFFFSPPSLGTEAEEILTSRFGMIKFTLRLDEERIDPLLADSKVISQKQLTGAGPHNDSCPFATGKPLIAVETTPYNLCSPCAVDSEIGKPMMRIPLMCAETVCGALTLNLERLPSELEHPEFTHAFLRLVNDAFEVGMLREANRLLEITDSLTRVHNYRYFIKSLEQELERSRRYDHPFSIVVFDIDEFKSFNDRHGYAAGDLILKETAAVIRRCIRTTDITARYSGDRFAIILTETARDGVAVVADKIMAAVSELRTKGASGNEPIGVTLTYGAASFPDDAALASRLLSTMEDNLRKARNLKIV